MHLPAWLLPVAFTWGAASAVTVGILAWARRYAPTEEELFGSMLRDEEAPERAPGYAAPAAGGCRVSSA